MADNLTPILNSLEKLADKLDTLRESLHKLSERFATLEAGQEFNDSTIEHLVKEIVPKIESALTTLQEEWRANEKLVGEKLQTQALEATANRTRDKIIFWVINTLAVVVGEFLIHSFTK